MPPAKVLKKSGGGSVADSMGAFPFSDVDAGAARVMKKAARTQAQSQSRHGEEEDPSKVAPFKPDGRSCKCCGGRDSDTDPVDGHFLAWYYAPRNGVSQGHYCFYCAKVWYVYFRMFEATGSLTKLVNMLGRDEDIRCAGIHKGAAANGLESYQMARVLAAFVENMVSRTYDDS